jgi:hypothetical protein
MWKYGMIAWMGMVVLSGWGLAGILRVERDGSGNFWTIQEAIDAAVDGDVIWVGDGTYTGAGNRDIDFLGKAITVRSDNGPTNCIIDCGGSEADPHLGFYFHNAEGPDSIIDGFTIINGYHEEAGAIYCTYVSTRDPRGCSPTITRCVIRNNRGMACGAIRCNSLCEPMISDCIIAENIGTYVGGISFADECSPVITGCIVRGNYGGYNGGIRTGGAHCHGTILNSVVSGNRLDFGLEAAGIEWWAYGGSLTLTNCTIVNNSGGPGVVIGGGGNPIGIISNCIIWGNTGNEWSSDQLYFWQMTPAITYCAIQGGWPDAGNIDVDPLFIDADGEDNVEGTADDDLRLIGDSACLDAGDNSAVPDWMTTDVAGQPRIFNEIVDIGAYEGPSQGLIVLPRALVLPEGQSVSFTVRLGMDPGGSVEVAVTVASGDGDVKVASGAILTFESSNYAQPRTVTLVAAQDDDFADGLAIVTVSASGFPTVIVQVSESDNDHILYVDADAQGAGTGTSWTDAFPSLPDALNTARAYRHINEIRVAQGTYRPDRGGGRIPGDRDASFELIEGVTWRGGYAGWGEPDPDARDVDRYHTVLSGDLNGDDAAVANTIDLLSDPTRAENSYHVVTGDDLEYVFEDLMTVLDGLMISGGNANGPTEWPWVRSAGGGLQLEYNGSVKMVDCTFCDNTAEYGAAIHGGRGEIIDGLIAHNASAWSGGALDGFAGALRDCTITNNYALDRGGALSLWDQDPRLQRCSITNNLCAGSGGGIFVADGGPVLEDCLLSGNRALSGGAIFGEHFDNPAHPVLMGCVLRDNVAEHDGGAFYASNSSAALIHCILTNNAAGQTGGGIAVDVYSYAFLRNCTFYGNAAPQGRAVSNLALAWGYICPSSVDLADSILWDGGDELWTDEGSQTLLAYCDIQGGASGVGMIDIDPLFAHPNAGDFHLQSQAGRWDPNAKVWIQDAVTSPCIDAGDPASPIMVEPFPNGGVINMGAYGGTAEASKSFFGKPVCEVIVAGDINGDCRIDLADYAILARHWLENY